MGQEGMRDRPEEVTSSRAGQAAALAVFVATAVAVRRRRARVAGNGAHRGLANRSRIGRTTQLARTGASVGATYASHQVRRAVTNENKRAALDAAFELRSTAQVTEALGNMKGVLMKLGQMASFVNEGFPDAMRDSLAQLQADAPPMSGTLAAEVIERELGRPPEQVFARWNQRPVAAASIGQVHRATLHDGTEVAVKVQYPGVDAAIKSDLDNTSMLTQMLGLIFKGLDVAPFVAELRARIGEELDYRLEATRQSRFGALYAGHPAIHIPAVFDRYSTTRVLTTEWAGGGRFSETASWDQAERDLAGEIIYRFVFRSLNRYHVFNGDPHPGNYLFERGGPLGVRVTFLDFGLVKEFLPSEVALFQRMIRLQVTHRDVAAYRATIEEAGLLRPGAPYSNDELMDYFGYFYHPVLEDCRFTYTRAYAREALKRTFDPAGPHTEMMKWFNLPPSFVVLNRIQWGLNAVLAALDAEANWRRISNEVWPWVDGPPSTPLGEAEAAWLARQRRVPTG